MRRSIMKAVFLTFLAGVVPAGEARAQNREKSWEIMPYFGRLNFGSETQVKAITGPNDTLRTSLENDLTYGFRFAYHWTKQQMIEFNFAGAATNGTANAMICTSDMMMPPTITCQAKSADFSADVLMGRINYVYNFFLHRRDKVVIYVTGGIGVLNFSTFGSSPDPDMQRNLDALVGDENDFLFNYGGGLRLFGGPRAGFRIDARQVRYKTGERGSQDLLEFTMGLTLVLGGT
jgi:outer membrane beta-barrel protein